MRKTLLNYSEEMRTEYAIRELIIILDIRVLIARQIITISENILFKGRTERTHEI